MLSEIWDYAHRSLVGWAASFCNFTTRQWRWKIYRWFEERTVEVGNGTAGTVLGSEGSILFSLVAIPLVLWLSVSKHYSIPLINGLWLISVASKIREQ